MANDTHSDTAAILGELESLKALLRTQSADGIPLLQETVTVVPAAATATPEPPLLSDGIPVLTQVEPVAPGGSSRYTDPELEAARRTLNEVYSNYSQTLAADPAPTATASGEVQLDIFQPPTAHPAPPLPTAVPPALSTAVPPFAAAPLLPLPPSPPPAPAVPIAPAPGIPPVSAAGTARPADPQTVKARGENPFLPKHIRDRLHTNKALVDIINESKANLPPAGFSNPDPVKQLIEQVIADFMPHIETELRLRLQQLVREGKLPRQPQE